MPAEWRLSLRVHSDNRAFRGLDLTRALPSPLDLRGLAKVLGRRRPVPQTAYHRMRRSWGREDLARNHRIVVLLRDMDPSGLAKPAYFDYDCLM